MSLRIRLRVSIVALVAIVVVALSALYLYDFTSAAFEAASKRAELVNGQVKHYVLERIETNLASRDIRPKTLAQLKQAWTGIVRTDPLIPAMLEATLAIDEVAVNIHISGEDGAVLVSTSPEQTGALPRQDFREVLQRNAFRNLWDLFTRTEDYTRSLPLGVDQEQGPLFRITVVIRSTLLLNALKPPFLKLGYAFVIALAEAMILAFFLPAFVLRPLERLEQQIDQIRAGEFQAFAGIKQTEAREFAVVQSKLSLLGQQFHGAKQDASELRSNIEEMLQRLEEIVLLFDSSGRLMVAGEPVERLLGRARQEIVGKRLDELFPASSQLGIVIGEALRKHEPLQDRLVHLNRNGAEEATLLLNLEVLRRGLGEPEVGTLITLRDVETRRQLELQLDLSRRLAAIGRLMGGVAHEIKNPLNAMALHLEVLKSKLEAGNPEIGVISQEIKRLDRVVKTFLNFNRPIDLVMAPIDISELTAEVSLLVAPDAHSRGIVMETNFQAQGWIRGDADLLKQAVLNVVMNAIEAMPSGGKLLLSTEVVGRECGIAVVDDGPGIPPEIQDKIFNLYFSTKDGGSGIGLAMAFRLVQLHSGTIEFSSDTGKGTSFRLRFPALTNREAGRAAESAHT